MLMRDLSRSERLKPDRQRLELRAVSRVGLQAGIDDLREPRRQAVFRRRRRGRAGELREARLALIVGVPGLRYGSPGLGVVVERRLAGRGFVEHGAESPDVSRRTDLAAARLL